MGKRGRPKRMGRKPYPDWKRKAMKVVGEKLRLRRVRLGLSRKKLGELLGVKRWSVWRYEVGERSPKDMTAIWRMLDDYEKRMKERRRRLETDVEKLKHILSYRQKLLRVIKNRKGNPAVVVMNLPVHAHLLWEPANLDEFLKGMFEDELEGLEVLRTELQTGIKAIEGREEEERTVLERGEDVVDVVMVESKWKEIEERRRKEAVTRLEGARKEIGVAKSVVARCLGVSVNTYYAWAKGAEPSKKSWEKARLSYGELISALEQLRDLNEWRMTSDE